MVMTGVPRGDTPTTMLSYKEQEEGAHLVDFRFELNPVEGKKDVVVKASLQPIEIIYDGVSAWVHVHVHVHVHVYVYVCVSVFHVINMCFSYVGINIRTVRVFFNNTNKV